MILLKCIFFKNLFFKVKKIIDYLILFIILLIKVIILYLKISLIYVILIFLQLNNTSSLSILCKLVPLPPIPSLSCPSLPSLYCWLTSSFSVSNNSLYVTEQERELEIEKWTSQCKWKEKERGETEKNRGDGINTCVSDIIKYLSSLSNPFT